MQDFEQRLRYCPDWGRIEPLSDAAIALDENQHSRARIGWSLLPSLALGSILRQENAMIKLVIGAALLVAITAPVLAQSSSTTTHDHAIHDQRADDGHKRDLLRGPGSDDAAVHGHDREAVLDHDSGDGQHGLYHPDRGRRGHKNNQGLH